MPGKIMKRLVCGVAYGCTILTVVLIILALAGGGDAFRQITPPAYVRHAVASVLVGVAFWVPTVVYEGDGLPMGLRVLIHMGTGLIVYFPAAFWAGWVPVRLGAGAVAAYAGLMLVVAWAVWLGFYLYSRAEARRINRKIREKRT